MLRCERFALFCGLLIPAAIAGGCQRGPTWNLVPVEGTVTKDGHPLQSIQVVFLADMDASTVGPKSMGITDEAGHYRLRTDRGDDGAATGKYRVLVLDLGVSKERIMHRLDELQRKETAQLPPKSTKRLENPLKMTEGASRVSPNYGRINETPLRAEVGHEPLVFDIVIP